MPQDQFEETIITDSDDLVVCTVDEVETDPDPMETTVDDDQCFVADLEVLDP